MTKQKHNKRKNTKKKYSKQFVNLKIINILLVIIIILILTLTYIIYIQSNKEYKKSKTQSNNIIKEVEKSRKNQSNLVEKKVKNNIDNYYFKEDKNAAEKFEEYTKDLDEEYINKEATKDLIEEPIKEEPKKIEKKQKIKVKPKSIDTTKKPKLAIVFDDVTTQSQVNQIKNIGFTTTISAMPPTKTHPNSAKITKKLPFYMIHFPLEANSYRAEETDTLHIDDSYERIEKRVAQIRKWYPNAKYTNNHTGSKFTTNEEAMDKLFRALAKYNFIFVDSRTTRETVAKKMAKKYNMPYIARNIFLDNEQDFKYIQKQLKQAIRIAKKSGYAIAIGHPHKATIRTLKKSKHLLKDLELVYLNQLPIIKK